MKKLVCKQVPPEFQGEYTIEVLKDMEGFAIYGNKYFMGIDRLNTYGLFEDGKFTNFEDMLEDYEYVEDGYKMFENEESELDQVIIDYINTELTDNQIQAIRNVIKFDFEGYYSDESYMECIAKIVYIIDGRKLELDTIRGSVQGDWQNVIYDPEKIDIGTIEAYYFNTGTEWEVLEVDSEDISEDISKENIEGIDFDGLFYSAEWHSTYTKEDLSNSFGYDLENVFLFEFDGWNRSARYKQA